MTFMDLLDLGGGMKKILSISYGLAEWSAFTIKCMKNNKALDF